MSYIRGYENGAKSVNPSIKVLEQYVSTDITKAFNDPTTGKAIAQQMIGQKADWIFQVAGGYRRRLPSRPPARPRTRTASASTSTRRRRSRTSSAS